MDTCASTVTLFVGRDANIRVVEGLETQHIEIFGGRHGVQHIGSIALDGATREQACDIARAIERAVGVAAAKPTGVLEFDGPGNFRPIAAE